MSIERAIFTSAETQRASGYHLVCRSAGLSESDVRDLHTWGPSHDSLVDRTSAAQSVNFFPLSSGAFCISRSVTAGPEYSGRGGWRVFTTCLILPPADLSRFADNPFAVVRAARAAGALEVPDALPHTLMPIELGGRSPRVDYTSLHRLSARLPTKEILQLVTKAFEHRQFVVSTDIEPELLLAGVVNTLPSGRRSEMSFTTGLRYSTQRPFRVQVLPRLADSELRHANLAGATVHCL